MSARMALWNGSVFFLALFLAGAVFVVFGAGERGIHAALQATARLSFLFFWPAYAGAALADLFGPMFQPLKRKGRELGLAFAAALVVHLALVACLSYIGATPPLGTFIFFGVAAIFTYLLALFSVARFRRALGTRGWCLLRNVGLNYIAFAFAVDFLRGPLFDSLTHLAAYLPFALFSILGPIFRLTGYVQKIFAVEGRGRNIHG